MVPNGLSRKSRLHLQKDFQRVFTGGLKLKSDALVLWTVHNSHQQDVRFAVVVSRKLGTAVVRNRTKRLLREAFRQLKQHIVAGTDVIVRPQDSEKLSNVQAAQDALTTLCGKAAILKSPSL